MKTHIAIIAAGGHDEIWERAALNLLPARVINLRAGNHAGQSTEGQKMTVFKASLAVLCAVAVMTAGVSFASAGTRAPAKKEEAKKELSGAKIPKKNQTLVHGVTIPAPKRK
jgi:hypothetical protein